jgi:AcrR family transcriptional regulator
MRYYYLNLTKNRTIVTIVYVTIVTLAITPAGINMAQSQSEVLIRVTAKQLFAKYGYDGVSMRVLSKASGVGLSSIYHFFEDKDVLLKTVYLETNRQLGIERSQLPEKPTAEEMLEQLINFQFEHMEDVVYVLKDITR